MDANQPLKADLSPSDLRKQLNKLIISHLTCNASNMAPQNPRTGMFWLDISNANIYVLKIFIDGAFKELAKISVNKKQVLSGVLGFENIAANKVKRSDKRLIPLVNGKIPIDFMPKKNTVKVVNSKDEIDTNTKNELFVVKENKCLYTVVAGKVVKAYPRGIASVNGEMGDVVLSPSNIPNLQDMPQPDPKILSLIKSSLKKSDEFDLLESSLRGQSAALNRTQSRFKSSIKSSGASNPSDKFKQAISSLDSIGVVPKAVVQWAMENIDSASKDNVSRACFVLKQDAIFLANSQSEALKYNNGEINTIPAGALYYKRGLSGSKLARLRPERFVIFPKLTNKGR